MRLNEKELLPVTRCVQFVPKYLHKNPTDRHITKCNPPNSNAFDECVEPVEDQTTLSMVFPDDPVVPEVVVAIPTAIPGEDDEDVVVQPNQQSTSQGDENLS